MHLIQDYLQVPLGRTKDSHYKRFRPARTHIALNGGQNGAGRLAASRPAYVIP